MNNIWFLIAVIFLWYFADKLPFFIVLAAIALGYFKAVIKNKSIEEVETKRQRAYKEITQLALLALELKQYQESAKISATEYEAWQKIIATRERELCDFLWRDKDLQTQNLDQAWRILQEHSSLELAEPPWYEAPPEPVEIEPLKPEPVSIESIITESIAPPLSALNQNLSFLSLLEQNPPN